MRRAGVLAATGMLAAALLGWALVTPGYRGPDEPQHVSTALRLARGGGYPDPGTPRIGAGVRGSYAAFGFSTAEYVAHRAKVERHAAASPSTKSLRDADGPYPDAHVVDQMTQHPPGYYGLLAAFTKVLGLDDASANTMLLVLRLLSAALLLPIPLLIAATLRRLGLPPPVQLLGALVPAAWTQFVHIGAVVNSGALLALAASTFVYGLVSMVTGNRSLRMAFLTGISLFVALSTKGFALALLALPPFAYVAARRRDPVTVRACAAVLVPSLLGLVWWVRNVVVFRSVQPSGEELPAAGGRALRDWPEHFLNEVSASMWVNLGWLETPLSPRALHLGVSAVALVLVAYGTYRLRHRTGVLVVLHGAWLLPLTVFALGSARIWQSEGVIRAAQGRYLHAAVLPIAVLLAVSVERWPRVARFAPLCAALSVLGGLAFGLRHFWDPVAIETATSMWPLGTALLAAAAALFVASAAVATVVAQRDT